MSDASYDIDLEKLKSGVNQVFFDCYEANNIEVGARDIQWGYSRPIDADAPEVLLLHDG
jgi:hypothetical protein|tara:strand:- start:113 stop:289 length:177 start_codon:yes stop_codon:yes gene_type:complete